MSIRALILAALLVLFPGRLWGAEAGVLLLPGASESLVPRARVALGLSEGAPLDVLRLGGSGPGASIPLYALPLRQTSRCPDRVPTVGQALDGTFEALDFLDLDGARAHLEAVDGALRCGAVAPTTLQLGRLFFARGTLAVYAGADGAPYFADALGVTPDLPRIEDYPESVVAAYEAGRSALSRRERVEVTLAPATLAGARLQLNGRAMDEGALYLPAGRHVLGWVSASGEHLGSAVVEVVPGMGPQRWPPEGVAPSEPAILGEILTQAAQQGRISAGLERSLGAWLQAVGLKEILLVTPEGQALLVGEGAAPHALTLPEAKGGGVKTPTLVAAAAGALALGSGGYYAYTWRRLSTEVFPSYEAMSAVRTRGHIVGGVGIGLAATSGAFIGLSVLGPREGMAEAELGGEGGDSRALALQVGGRW